MERGRDVHVEFGDDFRLLPDDALFKGILDQLVQQTLLAQSVEPTLSKRDRITLENERRGNVSAIALDGVVRAAVTDAALQAAYDAKFKDFQPGTEYRLRIVETPVLNPPPDSIQIHTRLDQVLEQRKAR